MACLLQQTASFPTCFKQMNNVELVSMFGSVAKACFPCKGLKFVIQLWRGVVVSNVCWALWRALLNYEY